MPLYGVHGITLGDPARRLASLVYITPREVAMLDLKMSHARKMSMVSTT